MTKRITPDQAANVLKEQANDAFVALVFESASRIVKKTPVDTGRARANWNISQTAPDRSVSVATDTSGAIALGRIAGNRTRLGTRTFLANSLPYIGALEDGSSKQAPAGMVKVTAAEMGNISREVAAKVKAAL